MDEMRDRLIGILKCQSVFIGEYVGKPQGEYISQEVLNDLAHCIADSLIKAGMLLPKFKEGQEVWHLIADSNNSYYIEDGWQYVAENKDKAVLCYPKEKGSRNKKIKRKDWVFATESEARAARAALEDEK